MTDALTIAAEYEVDTGSLVGVNDYSMGHEAGQMLAAERIADLIRYHEAESPAVALLRHIRDTQPDNAAAGEIGALLERLAERSEQDPASMGFSRAMFHARENAGKGIGVRRPGKTSFVFYDATVTFGGEFGLVRQSDDGSVSGFRPDMTDIASTEWIEYAAP